MAALPPPQVVVAPEPEPIMDDVTCILTVDNEMRYVSFNDEVLTAEGDYANWGAVKTINF